MNRDQRLTVLATALRTALVADGGNETLWERLDDLGVPIDDLLCDALPMSSPPYSWDEFNEMTTDAGRR